MFTIDEEILRLFPGMRIAVAIARDLDNTEPHPEISSRWSAAWVASADAAVHGNSQSHPRVAPWREAWRGLGVSGKKYPTSIEALLRRALKGGDPFTINPLVDFYNALSLTHVVPAGGFDLAELDGAHGGSLELRLTTEGDTFEALDDPESVTVPAGEVAYATGSSILTRHLVWRQSRRALISPQTRDVIIVSEVLGDLPPALADDVAAELDAGLRDCFDASPCVAVLDDGQRTIEW